MISSGLVAPLFVPASRPDRFEKAAASGADAIIVDLEDAVPPELKNESRRHLDAALSLQVPAFIRINGLATRWHQDDLDALAVLNSLMVCLPKVETVELLDRVVERLGPKTNILAQIETAVGVKEACAIAAHPNVSQLAFGPADFFLDMGMNASRALSAHVLATLSIASRAAGKPRPLDGPAFAVGDQSGLEEECRMAAANGAGGKLCIHPSQVRPVLSAFGPSEADIAWATRIVAADKDGSARLIDGQMIDAPIIARAKALLKRLAQRTDSDGRET